MRKIALIVPVVAFLAGCGTTTTVMQQPTPPAAGAPEEVVDTPEPAAVTPKPEDFQLRVKTLRQQCFGSAGCNVTFTIRVSYSGATLPDDKEHQVTYKVIGGTEPLINTFKITGDQATISQEEIISTRSATTRLRAKIIEIE